MSAGPAWAVAAEPAFDVFYAVFATLTRLRVAVKLITPALLILLGAVALVDHWLSILPNPRILPVPCAWPRPMPRS